MSTATKIVLTTVTAAVVVSLVLVVQLALI